MSGFDPAGAADPEREERIEAAVTRLDLDAKVRLLTGAAMFGLAPEPLIGLAETRLSDGPTGVRGPEFIGGPASALLPNATLIAQHWSRDTAHDVGALLAEEASAQGVHVLLGPTVNLHRTPLGGRLFEAFSEDPLLTGDLAVGYVRGVQQGGVAATPKHFLANESETDRTTMDSVVDERTLREVYLLPFEMLVAEAGPWAVMASYNRVNGTPATEHRRLIEGVLKGEWRYDGLVMSDWFATTSTAASANGGLDLVMPGPGGPWGGRLVEEVRSGSVPEPVVDEHLRRLLRLADRVGTLGPEPRRPVPAPAPDSPARRDALRRLAAGGMTVLVNRRGTLPLTVPSGAVALIGRHATETVAQGGGSAMVRPPHVVGIAEGLTAALGTEHVRVVDGVEVRERPVATEGLLRDPVDGSPGIRVVARDADGGVVESRHIDGADVLAGHGDGWLAGAATVELSAELVLDQAARVQIGVRGSGSWTVRAPGISETTTLASTDGPGADMLSPPVWTAESVAEPGAPITATATAGDWVRLLGLVARRAPRPPQDAIAEAAEAARESAVAVVVVGLTQEQENEGGDKATLALPGEQDALVEAVAGAAERTVVVVNAATPVLMPWLDRVDAVLWAGLPGQEAGAAVADALLGEVEPAGRLVTTFPAHDGRGPAWSPVPVDGVVRYTEGPAVGYRGWDASGEEPLFWFGHGLGYATWEYGAVEADTDGGVVRTVVVWLANTATHPGREVVQVYLRPAGDEPVRLIGWEAVTVAAQEETRVRVDCDPRVQRVWDPEESGWTPLAGGEILVARGLGDVRARIPLEG
ncbi:glycoside hydrolase family 3 C-terminal domain-containing protein [Nocardiopsis mangrovi]|uniref:Glycoside hydrolase family 3 C-terminal domain-containing protein n=1 Tax=Nocardiopsis mangrovi TaxID=1179818 RepID=A0ABV9E176_9ACTN